MKTLGIVVGIIFLLLLLIAAAGYVWWQSNGDELMQSGRQAMQEGRAFAADASQNECVERALLHSQDCSSIVCQTKARLFLQACLNTAEKDSYFCDDVPGRWDIMETVNWSLKLCTDLQQNNANCPTIVTSISEYCSGKSEARTQ
ncbi:MAG: hypothetical protein KZQ58_01580 [gamma proteobacterium symbiont of Bathyaustriella thionipta]|nr:hypothetical protein [gamma proteobacterium symbiont of Bathyaustriella thionipta]